MWRKKMRWGIDIYTECRVRRRRKSPSSRAPHQRPEQPGRRDDVRGCQMPESKTTTSPLSRSSSLTECPFRLDAYAPAGEKRARLPNNIVNNAQWKAKKRRGGPARARDRPSAHVCLALDGVARGSPGVRRSSRSRIRRGHLLIASSSGREGMGLCCSSGKRTLCPTIDRARLILCLFSVTHSPFLDSNGPFEERHLAPISSITLAYLELGTLGIYGRLSLI